MNSTQRNREVRLKSLYILLRKRHEMNIILNRYENMPFCRSAISFNFLKANLYFVLSGLLNFSGIIYYVGPRGGRQPWIFVLWKECL